MSILNVDKIQPIGSGSTVTVNATDTILTNAQAGVITATRFDGIISATTDDWITHHSDSNTRMGFPATDTFAVETAGDERLRITSAGKVGIGTDVPISILHLLSADSPTIRVQDTTNNCLTLLFSQNNNAHLGTYSNHPLIFDTDSLPRLHITNVGYVGINTDNPQRRLTVTTANEDAILVRATSTTQYHSARIHLQAAGSASDNVTALVHGNDNTGGSESYFAIESKNSSHSYLKTLALYKHSTDTWTFHTGTGNNGHERLKITSGGNIETKGYDGQCFKFNSDWGLGARNVQIWNNGDSGNWHSFVGTNLTYDGTNYIKPSDAANQNWGNIAGIVFEGANANNSSGNHPCIRFVADLPAGNGANFSLGSSKTNAIDQKTVGYFTPNKNFVINDGNLVLGAAGKGIDFSNAADTATGETTTSSVLDEYEEGTWVPTFLYVTVAQYGHRSGKYVRCGNMVHVVGQITIDNGLDTSDGSAVTIGTLPYVGSSNHEAAVFTLGRYTNLLGSTAQTTNGNNMRFTGNACLLQSASNVNITYANCNATGTLQFACQYMIG